MRVKTKDVTLQGKKYQVGKMSAQTACWIAMQILTKMLPAGMDSQVAGNGMPSGRTQLTEAEFNNIQNHCLRVCSMMQKLGDAPEAPQPLIRADGAWQFPDLDDDPLTIMGLTIHALIFNVSPFFDGDALKELLVSAGLKLSNASASTPLPSVQ